MSSQLVPTCIYVSNSAGVHDQRWIEALRSLGTNPVLIARERYASELAFHAAVRGVATAQAPVIAGPLEIALSLEHVGTPVVLLSWGFDLQEAASDLDLSAFSTVIVDSSANEQIANRAGANQIINIPWGIDIQAIDESSAIVDLTDHGISPDERVVLSLRAHESRYRVTDIIEAFARRPRAARLVVGNSGSLTDNLQHLAESLNVDAVFLPPVREDEVPALLRRASAYVTASEVDGTSVTLLQAMACKVPVVASANAGNVDWIRESVTGFSFPIGDIQALDQAIDRALDSDPEIVWTARSEVEERADWQRNIRVLRPLFERKTQEP